MELDSHHAKWNTRREESSKGFSSSRRSFLQRVTPMFALPFVGDKFRRVSEESRRGGRRDYSVCLSPDIILKDPGLLDVVGGAGVNAVWIATYFYGFWPYPAEKVLQARKLVLKKGMVPLAITIPFGHPGDALQAGDDSFPLISPPSWPRSVDINGKIYAGTSVGEIVNIENAGALEEISKMGFKQCMLDDDFRIARGPGVIGGSFDSTTRDLFLEKGGYAQYQWDELLQNIRERQLTGLVRAWVNWYCDQMTHSFHIQQNAFRGDLGIMVMYLGAEKAGIRLTDFPDVNIRVGELHFNDRSLLNPKGWTDELFSALFHRRYIKPENAWSETTAFPADALSVANMCAKLTVSTIADVRHTTFMSGLTPFPKSYWATLSTAMRVQKGYHEKLAGHQLKGPFKHFWGEASRYVGKDKPFSLWLALGIPFEVIERLGQGQDGWIFMSDEDYDHLERHIDTGNIVAREGITKGNDHVAPIPEDFESLWKWRKGIEPQLRGGRIPYILEEWPCVCAWYPTAKCVLVWNLSATSVSLTVQFGDRMIRKDYKALESLLIIL